MNAIYRFFIIMIFFSCLAVFGSSLRNHFWPFTDVLREIWPAVTRKMWGHFAVLTADHVDITDRLRRHRQKENKRAKGSSLCGKRALFSSLLSVHHMSPRAIQGAACEAKTMDCCSPFEARDCSVRAGRSPSGFATPALSRWR